MINLASLLYVINKIVSGLEKLVSMLVAYAKEQETKKIIQDHKDQKIKSESEINEAFKKLEGEELEDEVQRIFSNTTKPK